MRRRSGLRQLLLGVLVLFSVGLMLWMLRSGVEEFLYRNSDSIGRAAIDTERRLRNYERTGDAPSTWVWLNAYHGEAPSRQVMISLAEWGQRNPGKFQRLASGLPKSQWPEFVERFGWALADSGQIEQFEATFRTHSFPLLDELRRSWAGK